MESREQIFYQFYESLVENYRNDISKRDDVKELAEKEKTLWNQIIERFGGTASEEYRLIHELVGYVLDAGAIKQEQLYLQGVKDGIRMKQLIEQIEKGE